MAVKVFRNSDTNAPKLNGAAGSLTDVLLACLVNGYGSVFATGTITSNGTNVSNNDTVTVDNITYTFKTSLTPAANEVLIGASAAASLTNLNAAIDLLGTSGTTYGASTQTPQGAYATNVTSTVITITARKGGTGGNSISLAKSAATLTVSGSVLSGGSGSDTIASAGWSNPFNGNGGQRVFKGGSGVQHFYHFDDANPNGTANTKEAQFRGSEGATGFQNATAYFPTTAAIALGSGLYCRKSTAADTTARSWIIIADDRTVYGFMNSGDGTGYQPFHFGEHYSITSATDNYRSRAGGRSATGGAVNGGQQYLMRVGANTNAAVYFPRIYTGSGSAVTGFLSYDNGVAGTTAGIPVGIFSGVEPATGAIILLPLRVHDSTGPMRGRLRGCFGSAHTAGTFGDGDLITGAGAYAGRTFLAVVNINDGGAGGVNLMFDTTGPWETN